MPPIMYPFEHCKNCKDFKPVFVDNWVYKYETCAHAYECKATIAVAKEEKEEPFDV